MKKITNFIVNQRYLILTAFVIFTIISFGLSQKVTINYEMAEYLPSTSETRIGMDLMESEFSESDTSSLEVMFRSLTEEEKNEIYTELEQIEGVNSVTYENTADYNQDSYTLYILNVADTADSKTASKVYEQIETNYENYELFLSGNIYNQNHSVLSTSIVAIAVLCATIILIIMCESYVEPFLFLFTIGIAVILNNGTNILFPKVSNITSSISAILQMALSMDYSIMLINRYRQEREGDNDKVTAMKKALYNAFKSISSSSVTTIVGLVVLVFMSFTIGRDLGLVLAKGVLLSLISIFFCLPGLILMFDKLIQKTKKKSPTFNLSQLGTFSNKFRKLAPVLFVIAFIGSYFLQGNLDIAYTEKEDNQVKEVFKEDNQIAIIYNNQNESQISSYCNYLKTNTKINEIMCYGNTLNKSLTASEVNEQITNLGSNIEIEDYLIKILYYEYYNQTSELELTLDEFLTFVQNEVSNNPDLQNQLNSDLTASLEKLSNFTDPDQITRKRTTSELASLLEIEEEQVTNILVYYTSQNDQSQTNLSLTDFVNFMNQKVLTNPSYSLLLDKNIQSELNTLAHFTNSNIINQQMTSEEMANLFQLDKNLTKSLYQYYAISNEVEIKMSIAEFSNFTLNHILTNPNYASSFDETTREKLTMLSTFSNQEKITQEMTAQELANFFQLDKTLVDQLLLLKYSYQPNYSKYSLDEFITNTIYLKNNTNYLDDVDTSLLEQLVIFSQNQDNINDTKLDKDSLSQLFDTLSPNLVTTVYQVANLPTDYHMTPCEFVDFTLTNFTNYLTTDQFSQLTTLKTIMTDSLSSVKPTYTSKELADLFKLEYQVTNQLFTLIDYSLGSTSSWTLTPLDFVNLILNNSSNKEFSNTLTPETLTTLKLLSNIMTSSLNDTKYTYQELSTFLSEEETVFKNIYTLYRLNTITVKLTPLEFVNFLLDHQKEELLAQYLSQENLNNLTLLQQVMISTNSSNTYNSSQLANLLKTNSDQLNLVYALYNLESNGYNVQMSLYDFVNVLITEIMPNPEYSNNFDSNRKDQLTSIYHLMTASLNQVKYSSTELNDQLSKFTTDLDSNLLALVYTYYGSNYYYNDNWTLTIETLINYLNDDILTSDKYQSFIDDDMKNNIQTATSQINDSKKLLVGNNYSRMILNTAYESESEETFAFIAELKDNLPEDSYVIGDSSMASEMNASFSEELDFITLLTMLSIFIVVAFTFKSLIIPTILVFLIQCAVYITMGILSLTGGSVYFIAILIVQSILMGATIDYAILYTSYYLEHRKSMNVQESIIASYNKSIHTILTSSSILVIVTLIVGSFASATAAKICKTLSQGTFCSTVLILLLLPGIIATFDKLIVKKKLS